MSKPDVLTVRPELTSLTDLYDSDSEDLGANMIVYGMSGTGKTHLIRTCRRPILVHSFDPGGTKTNRFLIRNPDERFYADKTYEREDPRHPTAFRLWEEKMEELLDSGVFDTLGTFVIDSLTLWAEALMNEILSKRGKPCGKPEWPEYLIERNTIRDWMRRIIKRQCDFLALGHIEMNKDEISGKQFTHVMLTGQMKVRIPIPFDEVYVALVNQKSSGPEYSLLTAPDGFYYAKSRLGTDRLLDQYEAADIRSLLKKAGERHEDMP